MKSTKPGPTPEVVAAPRRRPRRWPWVVALSALGATAGLAFWARGEPDRLASQAFEDFQAEHPERAEADLSRLAMFRALTPEQWLLRGMVAQTRGRTEEALAHLGHVKDTDKVGALARLRAGQFERSRDRVRAAEGHFLRAMAMEPEMILPHRELIFIYGMQLRRPEMHAQFKALGELTHLTFDDLFLWCLSRGLAWEAAETSKVLRKYVEADPDDRASRLALADNLRRLNRTAEVESLLAALPPNDPEALALLAQTALDQGDIPGTEAILSRGTASDPGLARLRGQIALARRDWQAAIRHFRITLAADPKSRDALRGLGQALTASGDKKGAAVPLSAASKLDRVGALVSRAAMANMRENPPLMRDLGDACRAAGLYAEARGWYQLLIARDPLDSDAQRRLYLLDAEVKAKAKAEAGAVPVPVAPQAGRR